MTGRPADPMAAAVADTLAALTPGERARLRDRIAARVELLVAALDLLDGDPDDEDGADDEPSLAGPYVPAGGATGDDREHDDAPPCPCRAFGAPPLPLAA